jgi:hypothetical protein
MSDTLTMSNLIALGEIVRAAQGTRPIRWSTDGGATICEGIARAITHDGGNFLSGEDDVRDGYLWVSGIFERWIPVRDLMPLVNTGLFAID